MTLSLKDPALREVVRVLVAGGLAEHALIRVVKLAAGVDDEDASHYLYHLNDETVETVDAITVRAAVALMRDGTYIVAGMSGRLPHGPCAHVSDEAAFGHTYNLANGERSHIATITAEVPLPRPAEVVAEVTP